MIMRVNLFNADKKSNQSTLSVCSHIEHMTPGLMKIHVFKISSQDAADEECAPILPYFFRTVESLLPPYRIIFDLTDAPQASVTDLEDLIAIGLVFVDLEGRVVISGACEWIQLHMQNQGINRFIPQVKDLHSAISEFEQDE